MITLVIMDGFGIRKQKKGNAVKLQGTPHLDKLFSRYPHALLGASGNFVGLPDGQMGNSEAGHLTIGAGRRFYQPLERVNRAIKDGSFFENAELLRAINHAKANGGAVHIIGLCSDGGVHSHINHINAVLDMVAKSGLDKVFVHAILDGRDTAVDSGLGFMRELEKTCKKTGAQVKTLCGRAWAMDREGAYVRTKKAYDLVVCGEAAHCAETAVEGVEKSYAAGVTDEFVEPVRIGTPAPINNGDSVIFCNVRKDRARQFLHALTDENFDKFDTKKFESLCVVGLVEYDEDLTNVGVAFREEELKNGLAEVLSRAGKKQFHISETTKFAHVTYYFNCGQEEPLLGEDQKILEGLGDLHLEQTPEMRAFDITSEVMDAIASQKYDFLVVNFPNCDMVGHTGDLEATKTAVRVVDKCAYAVAMATLMAGGDCIITADHGNAEEMLLRGNKPKTSHTTNPVPFVLVSEKKYELQKTGELANIAPTILEMMRMDKPAEMSGSLLKNK